MRKLKTLFILFTIVFLLSCLGQKASFLSSESQRAEPIPASRQVVGDADSGYQYLVTGDYLKSGFPIALFKKAGLYEKQNFLNRKGVNEGIPFDYTAIYAPNGELVVAPNCLQCHAQRMGDSLVIGLGNSLFDFTIPRYGTSIIAEKFLMGAATPKARAASEDIFTSIRSIAPYLVAQSKGVNLADRLTAVLASYRDPATLKWLEKPKLKIPEQVIPTDVPAWWLLRKKNGMFYNGFGRGDFSRFLMGSNLLTVTDTTEAREVFSHFHHVLAYLYAIKPPKYPLPVNGQLAAQGEKLFEQKCSECHGTYGREEKYPNLLIPGSVIQTDSMLYQSNFSNPQFLDWFSKSWFRTGERPAELVPFKGYIAPPLDGIWITAPYFHNGSVPTLEAVLNSKKRPAYWSRDFNKPEYDISNPGWKYAVSDKQYTRSTYNTTLPGYSNKGHYFGDSLPDDERKAILEYLKTL